MRGSLRERRPGTWELVVSLGRDPLDGRYRQLSRTFDGTKREAQRALAELVTEVSAGRESGANATVGDLLTQWLDLAAAQLSPTTLRTYQQIVRTRLGPAIGSVRVRKLRAQQLDQLYGALMRDGKLSPTTVRQVHSVIRRALAQAVRWGWVPVNVAANATPPRARKPQLDPPAMADVQKILNGAFEENTEFGVFLHLVAASGTRRGRSLRRMTARATACGTTLAEDAFVFSESADAKRPWHPDTPTARFVRLRHNVGLDNVRLHDLRHMHATQLLAAGVPVRTVSGRLGHANAATTLNVYAHFLEASEDQAATVMGDLLRPT
jgi:integrase